MKIAIINTYCNGSTGKIAESIGSYAESKGHTVKMFYGRKLNDDRPKWFYCGENRLMNIFSNGLIYISGKVGSFHLHSTKKLINNLLKFNPDVIHIHNIHGNYLNFKEFFKFLSKFNGKVIITMHDEFLLTGRCALCICDKWETYCHDCKYLKYYPHVLIDKCKTLQIEKREYLQSIKKLILVTPSRWLNSLVEHSYISNIKTVCIYNGISISKVQKISLKNVINKNKINILFAAFTWSKEKGSEVINEFLKLVDLNKYNVIIAGIENYCENWFQGIYKKVGLLNREQLLYLLSNVEIFANPTFKDNLPTILIESIALGTPSVTFDTGGCNEIIDNTCGIIVEEKNARGLLKGIESLKINNEMRKNCFNKSRIFRLENMCENYLKLYNEDKK